MSDAEVLVAEPVAVVDTAPDNPATVAADTAEAVAEAVADAVSDQAGGQQDAVLVAIGGLREQIADLSELVAGAAVASAVAADAAEDAAEAAQDAEAAAEDAGEGVDTLEDAAPAPEPREPRKAGDDTPSKPKGESKSGSGYGASWLQRRG